MFRKFFEQIPQFQWTHSSKKVYLETDAEDQESERKVLTQKEATVKKSKAEIKKAPLATEVSSEEDQEEKQK